MSSDLDLGSYYWMTPTRSGLDAAPTVCMSSFRTTLVDVMTTLNTASFAKGAKPEILKLKTSEIAALPQRTEAVSLKSVMSPGRGGKTSFEKLRSLDAHYQRCQSLLDERDDYFLALYAEKQAKDDMQHFCATLIQAVFRGFNARPRMGYRWAPPRSPGLKFKTWKFAPNELFDELCDLAAKIKMPRLPGLTLEPRGKSSKRQKNIMLAARRRLVLFFHMIRARNVARRYIAEVKARRNHVMQKRIVRLFRMIFAKSFTSKAMAVKRGRGATKINNFCRQFLARKRIRLLKRTTRNMRRRNEGAIIITRNMQKMYNKSLLKTAGRRDALAYEAVDSALHIIFAGTANSAVGSTLWELLHVICEEQLESEVIDESADAGLEVMLEALITGAAQTAGELRFAEQMLELQHLQQEMEAERIRLEEVQARLATEEEAGRRARVAADERGEAALQREARAAEAEQLRSEAEQAAAEEVQRQKLELEVSFADDSYIEPQLSPLGFAPSTLAMPCSTVKLRGSRRDYDLGELFRPSVVQQLEAGVFRCTQGEAFVKDGSDYSYETLQSKLDQARQNFDAGFYAGAYLLYSYVFRWLLTRTAGDDAAGVPENANSDTTPALLNALLSLVSPKVAAKDLESGCDAGPVLGLMSQIAVYIGDCLLELCLHTGAEYKYMLAHSLRVQIHGNESNAAVAEVNVKLGHVYTAKSQFSTADSAYTRAVAVLLPLRKGLSALMLPALTPMSRAAATNPYLEDDNDGDGYSIGGYSLELPARDNVAGVVPQEPGVPAALDAVEYTLVQAYSGYSRSLYYRGYYELSYSVTQDALNACESLFSSRGERNELLVADIVSVRASLSKVAGLQRRAYGQYFEAREIYSETLGQDHPLTTLSNVRLAYATAALGMLGEAVKLVESTVPRAVTGTDASTSLFFGASGTLAVAQAMHCKGWLYSRIARYEEARPLLETCHQIRCDVFGYNDLHPVVAHAVSALADLAALRGEFNAALANYKVAGDKLRSTFAQGQETSAAALTAPYNLVEVTYSHAICLARFGKAGGALVLFEEVKTQRKKYAGLRTVLSAGIFDTSLSQQLQLDDIVDEAKAETASSVADSDILDGNTSRDVQVANVGIARQLLALGHLAEAASLAAETHRRIVALIDETDEDNTPDELLGDSLVLLGEVATASSRWSEADALLDRGCAIKEVVLGEGHPDVAEIILLMARNLLGPGYTDDAFGCCKRAAELLAFRFHKKSSPMALCLFVTADVLRDSRKYEQAEATYQDALYLAAEFYTEKSVLYGQVQASLGECYRRQKKFESAIELLPKAVGLLSSNLGKDHAFTLNAITNLAHAHLELGRDEEALVLLGDHVLPALIRGTGVERSPEIVYTRGLIGLCGHAATERETKNYKSREPTAKEKEKDVNAQNLIDDALEYFDTYAEGSYSDHHPWVLALGGFIGASPLGTVRTARTASTAVSSRSRQNTPRLGHISSTVSGVLPAYQPVDAVMDHLLLTRVEKAAPPLDYLHDPI